jgi:hypothetical protein
MMTGQKNKGKDVLAMMLFAIGVLVFFCRFLLSQESLFGVDFAAYFFPLKKFIHDHLLETGSLPFWNIYQFSGTPLIANIQASLFYPLGFLYYLLTPERAYVYSTITHVMLGGIFMYGFMRGASVSRTAGFLSAVIFGFNGYFMAHLYAGHLSFMQSYIWIPLVFHFLRRFIAKPRAKDAAAAGLVLGLQILGGFPQIAFYTILASFLFVILYGLSPTKTRTTRQRLEVLLGMGMVLLVAFAAAAVQVFPTLEFTRLSTRAGGVSYAMATYDSLHPKELLAFLMPDIFGNAVDSTYWRSKEVWHFWETCGYVGILPFFLVFVRVEGEAVRTLRRFFVILVLLALFLALGKYNPLYPLIYRLPGFDRFRIPAQVIFLYVFGMAALSGFGLDQILKDGCKLHKISYLFLLGVAVILTIFVIGLHIYPYPFFRQLIKHFAESSVMHMDMPRMYARISSTIDRSLIIFLLSLVLIGLRAYGKIGRRPFAVLACIVLFVDIYLFSSQFITTYEFQNSRAKQDIIAHFPKSPVDGRVLTNSSLFQANDGLRWKFPSVLGYDPLILRRYVQFVLASQRLPMDDQVVNLYRIHDAKARLLALLNIRQIVTDRQVEVVKSEVPYAQVVLNKVEVPSTEVLALMNSEKFNPREEVVLEGEHFSEPRIEQQVKPIETSCRVLKYEQEKIVIRVSTEKKGYLVLSEVYYPGWQAFVDGKEADVLCGNYMFRVIPLEPGDHEVRLFFVSWPFRIGVLVSLLTLSVCVLLTWCSKRKPKPVNFKGRILEKAPKP